MGGIGLAVASLPIESGHLGDAASFMQSWRALGVAIAMILGGTVWGVFIEGSADKQIQRLEATHQGALSALRDVKDEEIAALTETLADLDRKTRIREAMPGIIRSVLQVINQYRDPTQPPLQFADLGMSVYLVKEIDEEEHLDRISRVRVSAQPAARRQTWKRGDGAVGVCWQDLEPKYADCRAWDGIATKTQWRTQIAKDDRLGLEFDEMAKVKAYKHVWAAPIAERESDNLLGVISLDCTVAIELDGATKPAEFVEAVMDQVVTGAASVALVFPAGTNT